LGTPFERRASGSSAPRVPEHSFAGIMAGRERVRFVLEPVLGPQYALERANNIVQALALASREPLLVALDMLRLVPEERRVSLAAAVRDAWLAHGPQS
jgi:hypothetical protein